jgi:drug/metabolite transporter (DMT)-like permease
MSAQAGLYALVLLMVLCWGGNYVAAKIVFREIPSLLVMALRTQVSALVMLAICRARKRIPIQAWSRRELTILVALGMFGVVLNQFFWTLGVARTTVVHSSMIMSTIPVWVLFIAALTGTERVTLPKIGGMAIAICGIALLQVFKARAAGPAPTLLGDFYMLLCALTFAAMTAFGKRHKPASGSVAVNLVGYVGGAIALLPVLYTTGRGFDFARVSVSAWIGVAYMGGISAVIGYMIYHYALVRMPASRVATFQYLQPVFATALAIVILGEELTAATVAAGGVIFAGVYVTERFG